MPSFGGRGLGTIQRAFCREQKIRGVRKMLLLIRCPLPRTSARERSISSGGLPGPIARKENTVRLHRDDGLIIRLGLSLPGNSRMKVRPIGPVLGRVGAYAYDDLAFRQTRTNSAVYRLKTTRRLIGVFTTRRAPKSSRIESAWSPSALTDGRTSRVSADALTPCI
jgi:hypothetical protein